MVVVKTPDTVRSGWLEIVGALQFAHQSYVARKKEEGCGGKLALWKQREPVEAQQPHDKVEFVTRAIIESCIISKRL